MGKKKDKARRKAAERAAAHATARFDIPPQVAGIAAAAIKQVNTPAFQQMIAGALGAAAQAFDQRRGERRPSAPPPVPPQPVFVAPIGEPADKPAFTLSPEVERAIDQAASQATKAVETAAALAAQAMEGAAASLERWAAKQAAAGQTKDGHRGGEPSSPPAGRGG